MVEFPKISIKPKNCKTFYEVETASLITEISQPLHQPSPNRIKSYYASGKKFSYGDIQKYSDICFQSAARTAVLRRQGMMQCKCFS